MKAIICGAGQIGYNIASYLAAEENDIVVIEESPERISYVQETLDVQTILGRGSFPNLLESAGAEGADLLIAAMPSDEYNIIACQIADSLFKIPIKIAHIRNQQYLNSEWLDLTKEVSQPINYIISPERQVAREILSNLQIPGAMEVINLENKLTIVLCLHLTEVCPLNNIPLRQIGEQFSNLPFRVLGVLRNNNILIPHAHDHLQAGDEAYILIEKEKISRLLSIFGIKSDPLNKIVIGGGGNVGLYLAQGITRERPEIDLKIIENNRERAQFIAQTLENVVVLHGDTIDINVLKEANIGQADMFVAVTNDDAANILSSLLAKNLGGLRVTTLVSNMMYPKFLPSLGVDSILNPGFITISSILNYIRRGDIRSSHVLQGEFGEIFEADVGEGSRLIGEKFKILNIPGKSIVGGIIRDGLFSIPSSQDTIEENDHLILLVTNSEITKIEKFFRSKK